MALTSFDSEGYVIKAMIVFMLYQTRRSMALETIYRINCNNCDEIRLFSGNTKAHISHALTKIITNT